jgi:integrase
MNYARRKRYVPPGHAGIKEVEPFRFDPQEIDIFSPEEMKTLLRHAPQDLIAPLVLGAFCGLRTEEIKKLDWSEVHLERGHIEIRAGKAKTRVRRLPKICDNLREWLMPLRRASGLVSKYRNHVNELLKLAARCDVTWKRNVLRHSYISYRVAQCEDVAAVALHSGNSVKMIYRNYLKHVAEAEATKWFGITPRSLRQGRKKEVTAQKLE